MKGSIEFLTLHSPALEGNPLGDPSDREVLVYLPPGYQGSTARYPAVYLLHGFTGCVRAWTNASAFSPTVPERLDALIGAGAIPPVIAAFVDGWTALGGSQWINSPAIGRYRDYVAKDVVGFVDAQLRTVPDPAARAVLGKSSGGFGALVMGRHHPDVFGHIACHSGDAYFEYCYLPDFPKVAASLLKATDPAAWFRDMVARARATKMRGDDHPVLSTLAMAAAYSPNASEPLGIELPFDRETGRLREAVWARWLENDPVRFVPASILQYKRLRTIFVDCGAKDEFHLRWGARMIAGALRDAGVEVLHEEFEDGHMGINYRYDRSLLHITPRLSRG